MKIQLTKDKAIDISIPGLGGGGKGKVSKADLVGVELFLDDEEGCPAVRLIRRKNAWHLAAFGYVKAPDGELPQRWEDTPKQPTWELPREFQAPVAAIAVNSDMGSFGQASADAIVQEMIHGTVHTDAPASSDSGKKRFGIKRAPGASAPKAADPQPQRTPGRVPEFPAAGVPVSENGRRFAVRPSAEEGFHFAVSLPEFQSLWLGRLLPEGRRPTAGSIQISNAALMASVLAQPEYIAAKGSVLAIFVRDSALFIAGYKDGMPVLWRRCPGDCGYNAMCTALKKTLGIERDLIESVLADSLIDPKPALEPFLHPIMEQLELARAYLASKHAMNIEKVLLMGLPAGAEHWQRCAEETLKLHIVAPAPFEGMTVDKGVEIKNPHRHLVALGAALAASEVES